MDKSISRRDFLRGMAGLTAVTAVTAMTGVPAAYAEGEAETVERVTTELPIPEVAAPAKTEYECEVLVIGGGCYKPTGFPTGGVTFDGEYIAYNLCLPIAGKEFDDFHMTLSWAPGNAFLNNNWTYLDCIEIPGSRFKRLSLFAFFSLVTRKRVCELF